MSRNHSVNRGLTAKFALSLVMFASFLLIVFGTFEFLKSSDETRQRKQMILDQVQNTFIPKLLSDHNTFESQSIEMQLRYLADHELIAQVKVIQSQGTSIEIGETTSPQYVELHQFQMDDQQEFQLAFDRTQLLKSTLSQLLNNMLYELMLSMMICIFAVFFFWWNLAKPLSHLSKALKKNFDDDSIKSLSLIPNQFVMQSKEIEILYQVVNGMRHSVHRQMNRQNILQKRLARYASLLRASNGQLRSIFEAISDIVVVTNQDFYIEYFNQKAESLGLHGNTLINHDHLLNLIKSMIRETEDSEHLLQTFLKSLEEGLEPCSSIETALGCGQDELRQFIISYAKFEIPSQGYGFVFFFTDITENKALFTETKHLASHDYLTNLLNRYAFEMEIKPYLGTGFKMMQNIESPNGALVYININHFRIVNNSVGRIAGDALLRQVAQNLMGQCQKTDRVARLEGDIFAVLMRVGSAREAHSRVRQLYLSLSKIIFVWHHHRFELSISIGAVLLPHMSHSIDDVLAIADSCCRRAKLNGLTKIEFFSNHVEEVVKGQKQHASSVLMLEESMRQKSLKLFLQPIQSLHESKGHKDSFEVLVRIQHSDGGLIFPNQFLPAAELYQKVRRVDEYVIQSFLAFAIEHKAWLNSIDHVAINLSGESLTKAFMQSNIEKPILRLGLDPKLFCFEVTETVAVANLEETVGIIQHMQTKGFRFSLDDFGTGFSSYEYLHHLPVNFLKIDGSFIKQICDNSMSYKVVESMNNVAHHAGIQTIAEYVENEMILEKVAQLSLDYVQGYVHGKARLIDDVAGEFEQRLQASS